MLVSIAAGDAWGRWCRRWRLARPKRRNSTRLQRGAARSTRQAWEVAMQFGVFDHMDRGPVSLDRFYDERLRLVDAYPGAAIASGATAFCCYGASTTCSFPNSNALFPEQFEETEAPGRAVAGTPDHVCAKLCRRRSTRAGCTICCAASHSATSCATRHCSQWSCSTDMCSPRSRRRGEAQCEAIRPGGPKVPVIASDAKQPRSRHAL